MRITMIAILFIIPVLVSSNRAGFLDSKTTFSYNGSEPLNQFDSTGKKDGKWILYLDAQGNKLKDSTEATYWRYTYYDHGVHTRPMGDFIGKNGKIEEPANSAQPKKIKMLDGEYKCYEKGVLKFIHVFNKGEYISYKEFDSSGNLRSLFDYSKHFEGQPTSWYVYEYDKYGKVTYEGWVKKNEDGYWPRMRF